MPTPPLVVKVGGALLDDASALASVTSAIASMHRARPGSVIVVHGGGSAVDRHLSRLGMASTKREGIRVTPPDQMAEIGAVLGGSVNQKLVGALLAHGCRAVGLSLADGHTSIASPTTRLSFDPGCVGEVSEGDATLLRLLLGSGFLPVLSSVGMDAQGGLMNINADDAAAAMASLVGARALLFLSDVDGVLDGDGRTIGTLDATAIDALVTNGTIRGGMIPKVRGALETATSTGVCVIIASWKRADALVRLSRGEPVGTRIVAVGTPTSAGAHS